MSVNIANEFVKNNKKILEEYLELIFGDKIAKRLNSKFLDAYIEARYYNYGDDSNNISSSINFYLKDMIKSIIDGDKDILNLYYTIYKEIYYLDGSFDNETIKKHIDNIVEIREEKLGLKEKKFKGKIAKLVEQTKVRRDKYIRNLDPIDFDIVYEKLDIENLYNVKFVSKIIFNSLYSDFAVKNAFVTGVVNEDRMSAEYYALMKRILTNIIKGNFKEEYLIDFECSLFSKKKKLGSTLNILDFDAVKEMCTFKISYSDFLLFKEEIYELKRDGYNFSVVIDSSYIDDDVNFTKLQLFKYVIIDKVDYKYERLLKLKSIILM